ncbi:MAG: BspA family leucine-rich repeat surface protein [Bacilli bacterium]
MSRRLLMSGEIEAPLPSRIVFSVLENTSSLVFSAQGKGIVLKDKDQNIVASEIDGILYFSPNSAPADNEYTLEVEKLDKIRFQGSYVTKVFEFNLPNSFTDVQECFSGCYYLTEVRNITVDRIRNLTSLFSSSQNLETIDSFYVRESVNATALFNNTKISNIPIINIEDIGNATSLFSNCSQLIDVSYLQSKELKWTNINSCLRNTGILILENLTFTELTKLDFLPPLSNGSYPNLTTVRNIFAPKATSICFKNCPNLTEVSNVDTAPLYLLYSAFEGCSKLTTTPDLNYNTYGMNLTNAFKGNTLLTNIDNIVNAINASSSTNTCSAMFLNCISISIFPDISFSKVITGPQMFSGTGITSLENANIKIFYAMFQNCQQLSSVTNVVAVSSIDCSYAFDNCQNLTSVDLSINGLVEEAIEYSLVALFQACTSLETVTLNININSEISLNLQNLFLSATSLYSVNINIINDNYINDASLMFSYCALTSLPNLNYNKISAARYMFQSCSLVTIPNMNFDTCTDLAGIFYSITSLTSVGDITANLCTNASSLFSSCVNLTSIGTLTFPLLVFFNSAFYCCFNLTEAPILVSGDNLSSTTGLFEYSGLISYNNNFDLSSTSSLYGMFKNCPDLTSVTISDAFINPVDSTAVFINCPNLTTVVINDASKLYRSGDNSTFGFDSAVTDLTLSGSTFGLVVPPLVTNVSILENLINSLGAPVVVSMIIEIGPDRLATISQTVIDNANTKGWIIQ